MCECSVASLRKENQSSLQRTVPKPPAENLNKPSIPAGSGTRGYERSGPLYATDVSVSGGRVRCHWGAAGGFPGRQFSQPLGFFVFVFFNHREMT